MTLTFDPMTLNMYSRWRVMCSIYVPNLNKISRSAAELLTINDRFFVRFRGAPILPGVILTSSSAIAEKPHCSVGQFWVAITPYSADRPISIKSNQIEIID